MTKEIEVSLCYSFGGDSQPWGRFDDALDLAAKFYGGEWVDAGTDFTTQRRDMQFVFSSHAALEKFLHEADLILAGDEGTA